MKNKVKDITETIIRDIDLSSKYSEKALKGLLNTIKTRLQWLQQEAE